MNEGDLRSGPIPDDCERDKALQGRFVEQQQASNEQRPSLRNIQPLQAGDERRRMQEEKEDRVVSGYVQRLRVWRKTWVRVNRRHAERGKKECNTRFYRDEGRDGRRTIDGSSRLSTDRRRGERREYNSVVWPRARRESASPGRRAVHWEAVVELFRVREVVRRASLRRLALVQRRRMRDISRSSRDGLVRRRRGRLVGVSSRICFVRLLVRVGVRVVGVLWWLLVRMRRDGRCSEVLGFVRLRSLERFVVRVAAGTRARIRCGVRRSAVQRTDDRVEWQSERLDERCAAVCRAELARLLLLQPVLFRSLSSPSSNEEPGDKSDEDCEDNRADHAADDCADRC